MNLREDLNLIKLNEKEKTMAYKALRGYENKLCSGAELGIKEFYEGVYSKQILEIGFGKGDVIKQLSKQGNKCYGIEASKLAIIHADSENINANLILLNVSESKLPYQDGQFDSVYIYNVIEFLENPLHCFQEIKRVLKADGELCLCFKDVGISAYPNFINHNSIVTFLKQLYFKVEETNFFDYKGFEYIKAINKKVDRMEILDALHNDIDYEELYVDINERD